MPRNANSGTAATERRPATSSPTRPSPIRSSASSIRPSSATAASTSSWRTPASRGASCRSPSTRSTSSTGCIAVNVRGVWLGLRAVIPVMTRRGGGSIVITSSTAGIRGSAGTLGVHDQQARRHRHDAVGVAGVRPLKIRVNTVNPSPIETRMMRSLEQQRAENAERAGNATATPEQIKAAGAARIPLGRYGAARGGRPA